MASIEETSQGQSSGVPQKMRWLYVFAIGLGFFTTGVSWSVYNSYMPSRFLPDFITGDFQNTIIGAIMVLDNLLALFLQPYLGGRSDRTRTRWGRRMPYIMLGTPTAALFFVLVAYGWAQSNFWFMLYALTVFNVAMAIYRAPVVALMPDLVASEHRSKANGVINLMGGIGAIYAFAIASRIYGIHDPRIAAILGVTVEQSGPVLTFLTTAIIMIVALLILFVVIKEPPAPPVDVQKSRETGILYAIKSVSFANDKSALALLGAIFMWFVAYNTVETWFTKYGVEVLGMLENDASFLLTGIALSFVVFAVPAGFIAGKLGRKNTIAIGIVIMIGSLSALWFAVASLHIILILVIAGIGWAFINVNSIVMIWQLLGKSRLGAGTGLYYIASMSAATAGPFLTGIIFDLTSIAVLFPVSIVFMVLALILTLSIRTGEVGDASIVGTE